MANEKSQNVQDVFLNHVRKNKTPVTVFLVNGVKLQGIITWFDNFSVLLRRDGHTQLVYKHAISTVMPGAPIQLFDAAKSDVPAGGGAGAGDDPCRSRRLTAQPAAEPARALARSAPLSSCPGTRRRPRAPSATARTAMPASRRNSAAAGTTARAAEARLAEAVGLAASIGLVVVHTAILPLRVRRPATLLGEGQVATLGDALAEQTGRRSRSSMRRCRRCSSATWSAPGTAR